MSTFESPAISENQNQPTPTTEVTKVAETTSATVTTPTPSIDTAPVPAISPKKPIWLIVAIIVVVIGIAIALLLTRNTTSTSQQNSIESDPSNTEKIILDQSVIDTNSSSTQQATWVNFTNQTGEIQFAYPDNWQVSETTVSASTSGVTQTTSAPQQQIKLQLAEAQISITTNLNKAPRVATKYKGEAFKLDGHELFKFNYLDPYSQTKQVGLTNSSYSLGFFSLGEKSYEVFLSYPNNYASEQEQQVLSTFTQILQSMRLPKQTPLASQDWQTYIGAGGAYTIKYPIGWRQVETVNFTGFGPVEIGEDILFGVSIYDTSDKTRVKVKAEIGKQFIDRQQTSEKLFVAGLTAEKVVTTTPSYPDWYNESIFISSNDRLYVITNSSQKNEQLQTMLQQRTNSGTPLTFEDFYHSFRLQGV